MNDLDLKVTSDPENLSEVRRAIEEYCTKAGFDAKTTGEIGLVVNEAMANIIRHAYREAPNEPIEVEAQFDGGILRVRLRDWGNGVDPSRKPDKTDPLTPGGLGLVCMRRLMDEMKFVPQPDGMLLELKKKLNK